MRKNYRSCHMVADYFLLQLDGGAGDAITNLKMQKMCYYAQGWSLALCERTVFDEKIKAWAHGPVIPELYHRFKASGWESINPLALKTDPDRDLPDEDKRLLNAVWLRYGGFSGKQLELMTHNEKPWREAYGTTPPGRACEAEITPSSMREYFGSLLKSANEPDSRAENSGGARSRPENPLSL